MPKPKKSASNTPSTSASTAVLEDNLITGDSDHVTKTYQEVRYTELIINPEENYRWGDAAGRDRDLKAEEALEDGSTHTPYQSIKSSIAVSGVTDPVGVVREGKKFRVIFGFTRATAATELRLPKVPILIHEGLSTDEEKLLQVHENAKTLRRAASWGVQTKTIKKLHAVAEKRFKDNPTIPRPKHHDKELGLSLAAYWVLGERMGCYFTTLRDHVMVYEKLLDPVKEWADKGVIGYTAAKEFVNGGDAYTSEFIEHVIAEIKRCYPTLKSITPKKVQDAKLNVLKWLAEERDKNGGPIWRPTKKSVGDADAFKAPPIDTPRPSPAAVRDIAANFLAPVIAHFGLSIATSEEKDWDRLKGHPMWLRVAGMGMGVGCILRPADADNPDGWTFEDLREREFTYVVRAATAAALRAAIVPKLRGHTFNDWLCAKGREMHMTVYRTVIVTAATAESHERIGPVVKSAWNNLLERLPEATWVPAIVESKKGAK